MLRIEAPQVAPEKGGLLGVVTPSTTEDFAYEYGVAFESVLAGKPQVVPDATEDKVFGHLSLERYTPFDAYLGIKASLMDDQTTAKAALDAAFDAGVSHFVEEKVQETLLNPVAELVHDSPVENPRLALGLLEQWASDRLGFEPLIQANRTGVSMLRDLKGDDGILRTKQGAGIANGGGYKQVGPGGVEAEWDEAWLYISAKPVIYRTEVIANEAEELVKNQKLYLAEARYLPIIQGPVGAIRLKGGN